MILGFAGARRHDTHPHGRARGPCSFLTRLVVLLVYAVATVGGLRDHAPSESEPRATHGGTCHDCLIALIAHKRPEYLRVVLDSLSTQPSLSNYTVLLFLDPVDEPKEAQGHLAVVASAREWLTWHVGRGGRGELTVHPQRLGCHANKKRAVAEGFQSSSFVVLIEEDTPLAPDGLAFMEWAKVRYRDDASVFSVSAYGDTMHHDEQGEASRRSSDRGVVGPWGDEPALRYAAGRRRHYTPWAWGMWRDRYVGGSVEERWHGRDAEMNFAFSGFSPGGGGFEGNNNSNNSDNSPEDIRAAGPPQVLVDVGQGRDSGLRGARYEVFPLLSRSNNIGFEGSTHRGFGWSAQALREKQHLRVWANDSALMLMSTEHTNLGTTCKQGEGEGWFELSGAEVARVCNDPGFHLGSDTYRAMCRDEALVCSTYLMRPPGTYTMVELAWLQKRMLSQMPCVVIEPHDMRGLPRNAQSVLLIVSRVSGALVPASGASQATGSHRYVLSPKVRRAMAVMVEDGVTVGVVHLSDEGCWDDLSWYSIPSFVFRNYVCPGAFDVPTVRWFPLGAAQHAFRDGYANPLPPSDDAHARANALVAPMGERSHLCAFMGQAASPYLVDRHALLASINNYGDSEGTNRGGGTWKDLAANVSAVRCLVRRTNSFNQGDRESYVAALADAAFTLCPRGSNEETFRVWEALELGSIPVIRAGSSQWSFLGADHPLPMVKRWEDIGRGVLSPYAMDPDAAAALQARVLEWYEGFKRDHAREFAGALARAMAMPPRAKHGGQGGATEAGMGNGERREMQLRSGG